MRFLGPLLLILTSLSLPSIATACSCPDVGPPCQSFWEQPVVFSGRVDEVKRVRPDGHYFQVQVRFSVLSEYRGNVGTTVELITGSGGGDCGYNFERDQN